MLVWLYGCSFWYCHETQFYSRLPDPLALTLFLPSFLQYLLSLRFRSCIVDVANGTGFHTLQFDWLHFFMVVSNCWKERLPPREWRTARTRTVLIRTSEILVRDWTGLVNQWLEVLSLFFKSLSCLPYWGTSSHSSCSTSSQMLTMTFVFNYWQFYIVLFYVILPQLLLTLLIPTNVVCFVGYFNNMLFTYWTLRSLLERPWLVCSYLEVGNAGYIVSAQ